MARSNNIEVENPVGDPQTAGTESNQAPESIANVGSPIKNGIARVAGYIFGRNRAGQSQEEGTHEEAATGTIFENENAHEDEEPVAPSKYLSYKRPEKRDIYELSSSPPESEGEREIRANSPKKRPRTNVKAKRAIIAPKRSARNSAAVPNRLTRAAPNRMANPPDGHPRQVSSPLKSPKDVVEQSVKRPRGRPRKIPLASPTAVPARNVSTRATASDQSLVPEEALAPEEDEVDEELHEHQARNEEDEHEQEEQEVESDEKDHGVSSILINPSPIKVSRQSDGQQARTPPGTFATTKNTQPSEIESSPEAVEDGDMLDDESEEETQDAEDLLFEADLIDSMISIANRVGHSYHNDRQDWTVKTSHKVCSINGKRMIRRLKATLEAYEALKKATETGATQSLEKAKHSIDESMQKLQTESDIILTQRLGVPSRGVNQFDVKKTIVMLKDLYFLIIPDFLKIMKVAADAYPPIRSMDHWALQQLLALTTMLKDLAETAAKQPKKSKPRAESKGDTYNVSKPTSLILPGIRKIRKSLLRELARAKVVQKASQFKASQAERSKYMEDRERRRDEEIRRQRRENRRLQREAYEALCSEPRWGRLVRYKNEASSGYSLSRDPNSVDLPEQYDGSQTHDHDQEAEDEDDDDPFTERPDDDEPRLSVFGKNNKNDSTRSRPLSEQEKVIFIKCMMHERGKDRYQKAAERLERSIEEIFTFAQELQEAMDRKHENGQFMSIQDDWTYYIWVEKENS
ncbi:hypothetical protein VTL71DRAFT_14571 [Oculimacula yallundae]|uniref:Myb-like domain-containing protein n=1 Tax=Oculimacula yallundae TaxID=86028 RepID=A0ABR4CIU8_9HELO